MLPEIAAQFDALKAQAENKVKAKLDLRRARWSEAIADKSRNGAEKKLGRTVELELEVDPR